MQADVEELTIRAPRNEEKEEAVALLSRWQVRRNGELPDMENGDLDK